MLARRQLRPKADSADDALGDGDRNDHGCNASEGAGRATTAYLYGQPGYGAMVPSGKGNKGPGNKLMLAEHGTPGGL